MNAGLALVWSGEVVWASDRGLSLFGYSGNSVDVVYPVVEEFVDHL